MSNPTNSLFFRASNGRGFALMLQPRLLQMMLTISSESSPNETGGMLIGEYDSRLLIATPRKVIESKSPNSGNRNSFTRRPLNVLLARLWRRTCGGMYYIGEWHSHPGGIGCPSTIDDETMFAIANNPSANCPEPILLIVGGTLKNIDDISVYIYTAQGEKINMARVEKLP